MTIPTAYLWALAPLTILGAIHAAFYLEELALHILRTITKGVQSWR